MPTLYLVREQTEEYNGVISADRILSTHWSESSAKEARRREMGLPVGAERKVQAKAQAKKEKEEEREYEAKMTALRNQRKALDREYGTNKADDKGLSPDEDEEQSQESASESDSESDESEEGYSDEEDYEESIGEDQKRSIHIEEVELGIEDLLEGLESAAKKKKAYTSKYNIGLSSPEYVYMIDISSESAMAQPTVYENVEDAKFAAAEFARESLGPNRGAKAVDADGMCHWTGSNEGESVSVRRVKLVRSKEGMSGKRGLEGVAETEGSKRIKT